MLLAVDSGHRRGLFFIPVLWNKVVRKSSLGLFGSLVGGSSLAPSVRSR